MVEGLKKELKLVAINLKKDESVALMDIHPRYFNIKTYLTKN